MKTLQILRHAKTERLQIGQQDFDRKLTERGLGQMADLIQHQRENLAKAELVLVSSAKRTRMTVKTMEDLFADDKIHFDKSLYLASMVAINQLIESQNENVNNLLLIGHNHGLSDFLSYLLGEYIYLPTSGYVSLELPIERWSHLSKGIASIQTEFFSTFR
jgi:phosphohistidine phosphatase